MAHEDRTDGSIPARREFLKGVGISASATLLGGALGCGQLDSNQPQGDEARPPSKGAAMGDKAGNEAHRIVGINPKNVVSEYESRGLAGVSDAGFYREIAAIISQPPQKGLTSFTLHAPLELMARYGLLRLVDPADRELARLRLVTSGAVYGAGVHPLKPPARITPFPDLKTAGTEFERVFRQADADAMDAVVFQIATQFGTPSLVHLLTPLALPTLTGASHSHIGLWLLLRHDEPVSADDASLLRAAARSLAADPKAQMKSFSGMSIEGGKPLASSESQIQNEIAEKLANPPKGESAGESIRHLVESGEKTGNADRLFGDFIRHDLTPVQIDAAFRTVLRVCRHSMLQHDTKHAKFGWTHCLTLPQSAYGLSCLSTNPKLALAAALVWTTAYRTVLSDRAIDMNWAPAKVPGASFSEALHTSPQVAAARVWHAADEELPEIRRILASEASIRNDIHLVKYTRACFDMGSLDPDHARLYLAATAYLCALWISETPRATLKDHLLAGRFTP